jgi:hypothetical protein
MSFENNIQSWVQVDNEIKKHNTEVKSLRNKRNELSYNIISYANDNNLNQAIIKISDGDLKFNNIKQTEPLTFKFIKRCLNECIEDDNTVSQLIDYMKEKRKITYKNDIKRSYK